MWCVSFAVRGINSPTCNPGVDVAIGFDSPRISSGASGFGSHVSCWGGPPSMKRTMQRLAFPNEPAIAFGDFSVDAGGLGEFAWSELFFKS
jgi:hypothetical protein